MYSWRKNHSIESKIDRKRFLEIFNRYFPTVLQSFSKNKAALFPFLITGFTIYNDLHFTHSRSVINNKSIGRLINDSIGTYKQKQELTIRQKDTQSVSSPCICRKQTRQSKGALLCQRKIMIRDPHRATLHT